MQETEYTDLKKCTEHTTLDNVKILGTHKQSNSGTHSHSDMTEATMTQTVTIHNTMFHLSFPSTPLSHLHLHSEQGTALYL